MPRSNPPQTLRKLALGNAAGDRAVQPGVHTTPTASGVRIASVTESPDLGPTTGDGPIWGSSADYLSTIDFGTLDAGLGPWPYAWTLGGRQDSTYPTAATPVHSGVSSWSVVEQLQISGTGTDRWLLTLYVADGGAGGSDTIGFSGGTYQNTGLPMLMLEAADYANATYIESGTAIGDLFFADDSGVGPTPGHPLADCSSPNDSADFWGYIKAEVQFGAMGTPINVSSGTGSGAAPTISQDATEPWTAVLILIVSGYDLGACVDPELDLSDDEAGFIRVDGSDYGNLSGMGLTQAFVTQFISVPHMKPLFFP